MAIETAIRSHCTLDIDTVADRELSEIRFLNGFGGQKHLKPVGVSLKGFDSQTDATDTDRLAVMNVINGS